LLRNFVFATRITKSRGREIWVKLGNSFEFGGVCKASILAGVVNVDKNDIDKAHHRILYGIKPCAWERVLINNDDTRPKYQEVMPTNKKRNQMPFLL
jgi:hypothetical protein